MPGVRPVVPRRCGSDFRRFTHGGPDRVLIGVRRDRSTGTEAAGRNTRSDTADGWRLARRQPGWPGGSGSRDRPAAASRRSTAWAAASGPFPGARVCSCPNTSAPAASSNAGHRQQRTQRKSHVPLYPARGVRTVVASPARPRRICAFAPPAGSNSPTRHVENCGRPARGLDSTGARSTITAGCMTAADGKCGHRFRTNLANRATRHGEAGSSTAGAIRAVRGGVTSSGIAATLFYNPRRPRCSISSHRTVTPTISTLCPALGQILAVSCRKPGLEPARPPHA